MTNNDILRRLRYVFNYDDNSMMSMFALAGEPASRAEISSMLKPETDPDHLVCTDARLSEFLNGLISARRGRKDGAQPAPETRLTNNRIFTKLKIALDLKADDILAMMQKAGFTMSKHELSALFRSPTHKHYRQCQDQALRNFLKGMQLTYRPRELSNREAATKLAS